MASRPYVTGTRDHQGLCLEAKVALVKTKKISAHLLQDKKITDKGYLNFVFLKKIGHPVVRPVSVNELIEFATEFAEENEDRP